MQMLKIKNIFKLQNKKKKNLKYTKFNIDKNIID